MMTGCMERSGKENWLTNLTGKYQQEDPQESSLSGPRMSFC